jgi:NADPH2:quinone reductase
MHAIRIHGHGGVETLQWEELPQPQPKAGELRVRVEAAGVNFLDIYQRTGLYALTLPAILGQEVAGVVEAVGPGVAGFQVGDRVATARALGGYAEETIVPAAQALAVPAGVTSRQAAALLLQGMTAHYLACSTFPLKAGDTALVHAAAGGVGLLLVQIAKRRGARVIATVGTAEKAVLAREAGADETLLSRGEDIPAAVKRLTDGKGVEVVYDAVGKDTFEASLNCLRPRGLMVSYGNASGPVPPFPALLLGQKGSLFLTRPTLNHYTLTRAELEGRAQELFAWVAEGGLKLHIGATFPLAQAAEAQRALQARETTGKILLLP